MMNQNSSLARQFQNDPTLSKPGKSQEDIEFSGSMSWLQNIYTRIPRSSVHLVGGRPGAGKTGILLQVALGLVSDGYRVHFVLTEQTVDRVEDRLGLLLAHKKKSTARAARELLTFDDQISDVSHLPDYVLGLLARSSWNNEQPDVLIIDSIHGTGINSNSTKVYKRIYDLFHLCRSMGLVLFAVGHNTKSNTFTGPQTLAHNVDTLTMIQTCWKHRFVVCHKNRFGEAMAQPTILEVSSENGELRPNPHGKPTASIVRTYLPGSGFDSEVQVLLSLPGYGQSGALNCPGLPKANLHQMLRSLERLPFGLDLSGFLLDIQTSGGAFQKSLHLPIAIGTLASLLQARIPTNHYFLAEIDLNLRLRPLSPALSTTLAVNLANGDFPVGSKIICPEQDADELSGIQPNLEIVGRPDLQTVCEPYTRE